MKKVQKEKKEKVVKRVSNSDSLMDQAIENIKTDRNQAQYLLTKMMEYILQNQEGRFQECGIVAAKYLETLQRSNEQLVKLVQITKKDSEDEGLTSEDREELYDMLNEEKEK
ncbi:MAG: hypothetical protein Q8P81_01495 [Nanoarchaeota archaeon]|nr:hypothetical protein [Nanoarchaeota archaeon]